MRGNTVSEVLLDVQRISAAYGCIEVLKEVSVTVHKGEIVTLIGANGAGKTTLLHCISSLVPCSSGRVLFNGEAIENSPAHALVRRGLAQVPEGRKIFPRLSVEENLELGAYARGQRDIPKNLEKVFSLFPILSERRTQFGGTLSGGEQQMLAIGRALMSNPTVLLLDEPSMGVAPIIARRIFATIKRLNEEGMTILLVEQNAHLALAHANRGYVLETGRIVLSDSAAILLDHPGVKEAYLGA